MSREYGKYGADPRTVYSTPPEALVVATDGNDTTGSGTVTAPYRTIKHAVAQVSAGGTVSIRGGSYHEGANHPDTVTGSILVPVDKPNVTIQNYNGEEVWLDGSQVVTGWTAYDGNKYRAAFAGDRDRTKTQTRGQDSSSYGSYLVAEYPIAHWPEMVLIDGAQQTQVQTLAEVVPGTFFVEGSYPNATGENRLAFRSTHYVLGTNPTGKEVRVGRISRALTDAADNLTLRGIGFRRYVPSLPDIGAVFCNQRPGLTIENVTFEDISDLALNQNNPGWSIRHCTFLRCGRAAINSGNRADNGLLEWSYFEKINLRRFNYGPTSGNVKIGMQWDTTVRYNRMHDTRTHAIWYDECCYRGRIYGNYLTDTYGIGVLYEISARAWIVGNIFVNNGVLSTGMTGRPPHNNPAIDIKSSAHSQIWHNTLIKPEVGIRFSEGYRKPLNDDGVSWRSSHPMGSVFGQDKSRTQQFYAAEGFTDVWQFYRDEMNWTDIGTVMGNNVLAGTAGLSSVQSVFLAYYCEDGTKGAVQMTGQLTLPNVYARLDGATPARFANSIKYVAGTAPSPVVAYFSLTGTGHEGSPSFASLNNNTQSTLTTTNVVADEALHVLNRDGVLASAPLAATPAEVQSMLQSTPFVAARYGAGDPVAGSVPGPAPGAVPQLFSSILVGNRLAAALYVGAIKAWPPT